MPGMAAGKSLVLRVTSTRPRTIALARITASGDFSRARSRRRAAARDAISASISSMPNPDRKASAFRNRSPEPFDNTSIHTIRLTQTFVPWLSARRISACAGSKPISASMMILASNAYPLSKSLAFVAQDTFQPPCRDRFGVADRPRRRTNRGILLSHLHNRRPTAASTTLVRAVATRPNRRYRYDPSKRRTPDPTSRDFPRVATAPYIPLPPHAAPKRATCPARPHAGRAI